MKEADSAMSIKVLQVDDRPTNPPPLPRKFALEEHLSHPLLGRGNIRDSGAEDKAVRAKGVDCTQPSWHVTVTNGVVPHSARSHAWKLRTGGFLDVIESWLEIDAEAGYC
jgi:hypothetical protein